MRRALAFLTPFGGPAPPTADALVWFPVVGLAVGGAVGAVWWVADQLWAPLVAAAIAVAADLIATGMLHVDGLADSADGLLPPMEPERRLDVMAAPDVGAYAVAVVATVLLLRVAALATLRPAPLLTAALWSASRTMMAAIAVGEPYARPGGLATAFLGGPVRAEVIGAGGVAVAAVAATLWRPGWGVVAVAAAVLTAIGVAVLARRRIGGYTGDVLGAAGVLAETAGLLTAAARW